MLRIAVCASGGGGNLRNLITSSLADTVYSIETVLVDRECGAIKVAKEFELECIKVERPENVDSEIAQIFERGCDLVVLAGFMPILGKELCKRFDRRIINTHPSLLPSHGGKGMFGVRVHQSVLNSGERETGCTVHYVSEEIDLGQRITQLRFDIPENISAWDLGELVFNAEKITLPFSLYLIARSRF